MHCLSSGKSWRKSFHTHKLANLVFSDATQKQMLAKRGTKLEISATYSQDISHKIFTDDEN